MDAVRESLNEDLGDTDCTALFAGKCRPLTHPDPRHRFIRNDRDTSTCGSAIQRTRANTLHSIYYYIV